MSEQIPRQDEKTGDLIFIVRVHGLPAMPVSAREVSLMLCVDWNTALWKRYGPLVTVKPYDR